MDRVQIEKKIKNLEHEIKYYESVYKKCNKLNNLREYLKYYKTLLKNIK